MTMSTLPGTSRPRPPPGVATVTLSGLARRTGRRVLKLNVSGGRSVSARSSRPVAGTLTTASPATARPGRNRRELRRRQPPRVPAGVEPRRLAGDDHLRPVAGDVDDRDPVAVEDLGHQPADQPPPVVDGHRRQPGGDVDRVGQRRGVEGAGLVRLGPQGGDGHVDPCVPSRLDRQRLGGRQGCCWTGGAGLAIVATAATPGHGRHQAQRHQAQPRRPPHATPITITGERAGSSQRRTASRRSTGSDTHPAVGAPFETCRKMAEPRPGVRAAVL